MQYKYQRFVELTLRLVANDEASLPDDISYTSGTKGLEQCQCTGENINAPLWYGLNIDRSCARAVISWPIC